MNIPQQKREARVKAFTARQSAHTARGQSALRAAGALSRLIEDLDRPLVVSGYMPIRTEIDPIPAMTELHREGHRICVPVVEGPEKPLKFRAWAPDTEMVEGAFGALVPDSGDWLEPEVLITPLLAFDTRGYRLGYGGGFYDRSLEILRAARPTIAVGYAYSAQQVESLPIDEYDQKLEAVITETGRIDFT